MFQEKNYEFKRAVFHIVPSLILVWLLYYVKPITIAPYLLVLILFFEILRLQIPWVNNLINNSSYSLFSKIIRKEEEKTFSALTGFGLGFFLISWMPVKLVIITILINALADPAARMFGKKWGKKKILNTKNSWVGSGAFFITAFIISICFFIGMQVGEVNNLFLKIIIIKALLVSFVGAVAEGSPDKGFLWTDNFRIPVFVGLALWWLF